MKDSVENILNTAFPMSPCGCCTSPGCTLPLVKFLITKSQIFVSMKEFWTMDNIKWTQCSFCQIQDVRQDRLHQTLHSQVICLRNAQCKDEQHTFLLVQFVFEFPPHSVLNEPLLLIHPGLENLHGTPHYTSRVYFICWTNRAVEWRCQSRPVPQKGASSSIYEYLSCGLDHHRHNCSTVHTMHQACSDGLVSPSSIAEE